MPRRKQSALANALTRDPLDPLVLPDGRVIEPDQPDDTAVLDTKPIELVEPKDYRPSGSRSFRDLSADPGYMRAVGVVFTFTMLGISDGEMASQLGISIKDIKRVRESKAYAEAFETILDEFVNANSKLLKSRIGAYAHAALEQVATIALTSKKEDLRLRGSTDILNRAGATSGQMEKDQTTMNELRISIVKPDDDVDVKIDSPQMDDTFDPDAIMN